MRNAYICSTRKKRRGDFAELLAWHALVWATLVAWFSPLAEAEDLWVRYQGQKGPGVGKHIVLISGDEEYRSEEALPQLAKILAVHHGFRTTVLFAIDPATGQIDPNRRDNIPGLEHLASADLMILFTRFRDLPDQQMKHIVDYVASGRPIIGMRTATHAFHLRDTSPYADWSWQSSRWPGGFGRQILGETWVNHHGKHGKQSTRGIVSAAMREHPILRGIHDGDIWGPTDVYGVRLPLPGDSQPLVLGQVLDGMRPDAPPAPGKVNDPMMPIAWIKTYRYGSGQPGRVFTTTMGASQDLQSEGLRRLLVNACYWALEMEDEIPAQSKVDLVGTYVATPFGFGQFRKGLRPSDFAQTTGLQTGESREE